ncbi:hypothetical protein [Pseudomonas fluorescens]|uniref:Uncharacterized protein n=1 Tax=Pseudomonas fluorescens TaxID=294 RepID=A0A5E6UJA0_PSEFL|nr:hypothetical protein [Pseudomonas fluorescens]VVN00159.1 hypothetical protein PS659_03314 [Pseudomonas fluorescens]
MPKYHVDQPITLYSGELILTAAQAAARAHSLEAIAGKKGRYTILDAVQFKAGEVIVIPGEPDKALAQRVSKVEKVGGGNDGE